MAKQLLGKEVTAALNEKIKANVAELQGKGLNPTLCSIRVGENSIEISYERGATKRCETLGVACEKILLPEDVSQEELLATIDKVNKDDSIHGVLLFHPQRSAGGEAHPGRDGKRRDLQGRGLCHRHAPDQPQLRQCRAL